MIADDPMCGILGVHNFGNNAAPLTEELLTRMRETLHHRGPNDAGLWIHPDRSVGMAFRRLSIIDLSPDGAQPMINEDGLVRIVFNGEIYNFQELRPRLESNGHIFHSRTDSEVILHSYEEAGVECLAQLDGMFAFAIWDERNRTWLLARDRLGVKPLYYSLQKGMLLFASEIKAILAHPLIRAELNMEALGHYLTFKTTPAPLTMFEGIYKLPAGCYLKCDDRGNSSVHVYWDATANRVQPVTRFQEAEVRETVRGLLSAAVAKRMVADVPVGAFLSGGLDSSAVVALMAGHAAGRLKTFSVGIKDMPEINEFAFAREVAQRYGTDHHEVEISEEDVENYVPDLAYQQDEPLADPVCVPLYYVSKLATGSGVPVILVGEGSDEQFLGYDSRVSFLRRYQRTWQPLLALPRPVLKVGRALAHMTQGLLNVGGRYEEILNRALRGEEVFLGSLAFPQEAKDRLLSPDAAGGQERSQAVVEEIMRKLRSQWPQADIATRMMYLDLKIRLAELLLVRVDKITMSVSLEAREPFMDYRLVEYTLALPWEFKLRGSDPKYVLKRATEDLLPASVIRRPKKAFAAPVENWFRGKLSQFARRTILNSGLRQRGVFRYDVIEHLLDRHLRGEAEHGVQIWTLLNLSAWYDRWISSS